MRGKGGKKANDAGIYDCAQGLTSDVTITGAGKVKGKID